VINQCKCSETWKRVIAHCPASISHTGWPSTVNLKPLGNIPQDAYITIMNCARRHDVTILLLLLLLLLMLLLLLLLLYMYASMSFTSSVFANNSTQKRDGAWRLKMPMQRGVGNRNNDDVNEKFAFLFVDVFIYFYFLLLLVVRFTLYYTTVFVIIFFIIICVVGTWISRGWTVIFFTRDSTNIVCLRIEVNFMAIR